MVEKHQDIIDSLSQIERQILPHLSVKIEDIEKNSNLEQVTVLKALKFLESKNIVKLNIKERNLIDLGTNGIYYKKNSLPERQLLFILEEKNHLSLEEAKNLSKLSENEFKVSLGILKSKALINLSNGKIILTAKKEELIKKTFEEKLLDILPTEKDKLPSELLFAFDNLRKRKDILEIKNKQEISIEITELGKNLKNSDLTSDLIEELTPEIIKNWSQDKKFRKYDIKVKLPEIHAGKKHFVTEAIEQGKKIWTDMGFKEMEESKVVSSFWNFDVLFTPQDHPAREMQDTFFIKDAQASLPKELINLVKKAHEEGVSGSKGWQTTWTEAPAQKVLLRTHTTCLSAKTLYSLRDKKLPAKYFAIGKCFRNESVDWSHGFEFNQSEGIVVDENANFRHLIGYLREFYKKMGFEKLRFRPSFFAYTEPSLEIDAYHPEKERWLELGGAGIFRPEVTLPLLGKAIPVLAWGPGFDRIMMMIYKIKDLREVYENDIGKLRKKGVWKD